MRDEFGVDPISLGSRAPRHGKGLDLCRRELPRINPRFNKGSPQSPFLTARRLEADLMVERNLDVTDTTLRNSVVFKVVQALRHAARRKLVRMVEKRKGTCVWAAGESVSLRVAANNRTRSG